MHVLLTGATGFVGSAVLARLRSAGHVVTAVVRSEAAAATVTAAGATALVHELTDSGWLADRLRAVDGAIHTAASGEGPSAPLDDAVIDAVIAAFVGTDKPYVHTGGVWVHGSGDAITEETPIQAPQITAWREERARRILSTRVKAIVLEPGIVYGNGGGIPITVTKAPVTDAGELHLIGDGSQHWTTVHVDDLADLYVLALESSPGGETYIGANGENPTVREIGLAASERVIAESAAETEKRLGPLFAEALLLDQQASGAKAKALGWTPSRPSLVQMVRAGY